MEDVWKKIKIIPKRRKGIKGSIIEASNKDSVALIKDLIIWAFDSRLLEKIKVITTIIKAIYW
jgi:hypothetical protein